MTRYWPAFPAIRSYTANNAALFLLAEQVVWKHQWERAQDVGELGAAQAVQMRHQRVDLVAQSLAPGEHRTTLCFGLIVAEKAQHIFNEALAIFGPFNDL